MLRNLIILRPLVFTLMSIMILSLSFCDNGEGGKKNTTKLLEKSELAKVSPELGLIEENNKLNEQMNCFFEDNMGLKDVVPNTKSENELSDWANQSIERITHRNKALCAAYRVARSEMHAIGEWAKEFKKAPSEAFLFYVWDSPDESEGCSGSLVSFATEPCENIVGLFTSIEKCKEVEDKVRMADIGTRPCRVWNKELIYIFLKDSPRPKT